MHWHLARILVQYRSRYTALQASKALEEPGTSTRTHAISPKTAHLRLHYSRHSRHTSLCANGVAASSDNIPALQHALQKCSTVPLAERRMNSKTS